MDRIQISRTDGGPKRTKERRKCVRMVHGNSGSDYNSYRTRNNSYDTVETTTTDYWISTKQTPHVTPHGDINDPYNPYNNPNMNGYNGRGREYGQTQHGNEGNNGIGHLLLQVTPAPQISNPSTVTRKSTYPELDISAPEYEMNPLSSGVWIMCDDGLLDCYNWLFYNLCIWQSHYYFN